MKQPVSASKAMGFTIIARTNPFFCCESCGDEHEEEDLSLAEGVINDNQDHYLLCKKCFNKHSVDK